MSTEGIVAALFVAHAAGDAMESPQTVRVVPGVGIPGDRYAAGLGHWSDPRWPDQQMTLIETELAEELGIEAALLRRNVVTRGVRLDDLIGEEFRIGTALLRGVRACDPCRYIETLTRPGLFQALRWRGGLRAAVVREGVIRVGDTIAVAPSEMGEETENGGGPVHTGRRTL